MRFIETIQVKEGEIVNLALHKDRSRETIHYHFGIKRDLPFEELLKGPGPSAPGIQNPDKESSTQKPCDESGIWKLRVVYSKDIEEFTIEPYRKRAIKTIKPVDGGEIGYSFKYENRTGLEKLLSCKGEADDILIIKDGLVTDTSFTNVVFREGDKLYTPSSYLLNGVKRRAMLKEGLITEKVIRAEDIREYQQCYLINAFLDLYPVEILPAMY